MIFCMKCLKKESTGHLIQLCDDCFDEFEKKTEVAAAQGEKYHLTDEEVAYFHPNMRTESGDGVWPDGTKMVLKKEEGKPTQIEFVPPGDEWKES